MTSSHIQINKLSSFATDLPSYWPALQITEHQNNQTQEQFFLIFFSVW